MVYYDIHTHRPSVHPEDVAIVNCLVPALDAGSHPEKAISSFGKEDTAGCLSDPASSTGKGELHSVGIHPWYIYNVEEQLAGLEQQAMLPGAVAIGEAGLDKLAEAPLERQLEVFKASAALAESLGVFLIIHCVKAWDELIALKKELKPRMPWVIHGFRGNAALAGQLIRQGFYLSFGEHFNPAAVRIAWPDRLFAETDDREIDIRTVYDNLSASLNLPLEQFAAQVSDNVHSVLHLS
ncbi:TatD family hydrolase [Parabacteroides acidifaciens]|uniref:TatD family deoxyribonuclease n=1 Tax=Parabacteroides acidifaciens TaxID=2290935 RepID=A0A3D8HHE4_9BACT|nr:TatD family hydrolase [Parabacteroides acidifaciens]MBC8601036.1 TatD family hydrolase [Parabacteroides acidifaciens]RDU50303.1 TatD family deoxyribonuclease [Parabacteroides acidifaciens]